jgi:hypothetical protein
MKEKKPHILEQANDIINNRSEEKEREYGPMSEGFERAAMIASGMSGKEWNAHDMFVAMAALKLSRQSYNFKEDNLLDLVAYLGAWQNYIDETGDKNNKGEKHKASSTNTSNDPYDMSEFEKADESQQLSFAFDIAEDEDLEVPEPPRGVTATPISPLKSIKESSFDTSKFQQLNRSFRVSK